jgi:ectoine hydroxylase-related dioxygenase (phytanoyl-CoA dioxygenase family)
MPADPEIKERPIVEASFRGDLRAALTQFRKAGFLVERRLVPEDVCDGLLAVAATRPSAISGSYAPIPMPHFDHPTFLAFMRFAPIVEIVEQVVGGRASGLGGEFFYMPPGAPGFSPHQDNFYVQAPPDAFISVWTALCEVGSANGGLIFYPESHRLGALPIRKGTMIDNPGQNPGAQAVECLLPSNIPAIDIRLEKGSVVFFHSELAHASHANRSERFRHSFLATYIRAGSPFRPGGAQQRREVSLH